MRFSRRKKSTTDVNKRKNGLKDKLLCCFSPYFQKSASSKFIASEESDDFESDEEDDYSLSPSAFGLSDKDLTFIVYENLL